MRWTAGRCRVIAGTGSNNTAHAAELSHAAAALGVDGVLVVNPYYNKPTQEGLFRHFAAVAEAAGVPVVVYNIKGRTAVNLETSTLERLWKKCPNIVAVKEASGDIQQMKAVLACCPKNFSVLSGDDNLTLTLIKAGGHGVVSVASNAAPTDMSRMVTAALNGAWSEAEEIDKRLSPVLRSYICRNQSDPNQSGPRKYETLPRVLSLTICELQAASRAKLSAVTGIATAVINTPDISKLPINVPARTSSRYLIHTGRGILEQIGKLFPELGAASRVAIVTEQPLLRKWLPVLKKSLAIQPDVVVVPGGESWKTIAGYESLLSSFSKARLDSASVVINFGGGVLTDVGGFAAATFHRGIRCLNVPTTLLAQVDSSIGGKTGINFQGIKNLIGVIAQPIGVLNDLEILGSLPTSISLGNC